MFTGHLELKPGLVLREGVTKEGWASGAIFDAKALYRYALWRTWDDQLATMMFLMLNPSTADELKSDQTVRRCERRALALGYGSVYVGNLFAVRSTKPQGIYWAPAPIGEWNDHYLLTMARQSSEIVCAWGNHGTHRGRSKAVLELLKGERFKLRHLGITQAGEPTHPLYMPKDKILEKLYDDVA